jgi:glycosyltransferase involved in cell wall biosynthesis
MSEPHEPSIDVAVNLLWCVPGQVGGSEQYLVRQLVGLASQRVDCRPRFDTTIFCVPSFVEAHPELGEHHSIEAAPLSGELRFRRIVGENTWLRRRTGEADLVHHGGGTAPMVGRRPIVLTIHDLQYRTHPEYLTPLKRRYLEWAIPQSVRRAAVIAVPTDYVRSTVIDAYGTDPDRTVVVPHGVEASLGADAPSAQELRGEYGLGTGTVIVFPAITHPHKNHRFLLELMARHWTDPELRLVLLGGRGSADSDVTAAIDRLGVGGRVVRPGRVSDAHRDGLIALADALVFPSEYEGFGAPVVEAMALGTPVICSDQRALAEVVGDAGLVLPLELDAWAEALDTVRRRGAELRRAGLERASAFTTEHSGAALADAYRLALEAGR